jgi:hypothetical protein
MLPSQNAGTNDTRSALMQGEKGKRRSELHGMKRLTSSTKPRQISSLSDLVYWIDRSFHGLLAFLCIIYFENVPKLPSQPPSLEFQQVMTPRVEAARQVIGGSIQL